ncbi:hypothetical protein TNCV_2837431 [Trichonephila clavipes]|nr:hypothetical protein TNCV_2837431 [Trichonephila clavipes]
MIHYRKRKLFSAIDVSEKAGEVLKTQSALDSGRLLTTLKELKKFRRVVQSKAKFDAKYYQNYVMKQTIKESKRLYPQGNFVFLRRSEPNYIANSATKLADR